MPEPTPTVVIVDRPNVGKSTLFNRITGKRRAIVGDEPGITRDRIEGLAEHKGRRFLVIDGRSEITGADRDLAQMLQKVGRPVSLAVNKIDTQERENLAHEFYSLGIKDLFTV